MAMITSDSPLRIGAAEAGAGFASIVYGDLAALIERLHRRFHDLVSLEIKRAGIEDLNSTQALLIHKIGEDTLNVGHLTLRGYYIGSSVTYNLKKLVDAGYVEQQRPGHDRRIIQIRLTEKGLALRRCLEEIFEHHAEALVGFGFSEGEVGRLPEMLYRLERFWNRQMDLLTTRPAIGAD